MSLPSMNLTLGSLFSYAREEIIRHASITLKSVCALIHVTYEDGTQGHGTGFLFSNKYFLLTCAHYLQNVKSIQVQTADGSEEAKIIVIDDNFDIAVIALVEYENQTHSHRYLKFTITDLDLSGTQVFLGGFRVNGEIHVTEGTISSDLGSGEECLIAD